MSQKLAISQKLPELLDGLRLMLSQQAAVDVLAQAAAELRSSRARIAELENEPTSADEIIKLIGDLETAAADVGYGHGSPRELRIKREAVENRIRAAFRITPQVQTQIVVARNAAFAAVAEEMKTALNDVNAELNSMAPDAWLNLHGRQLANREQELQTTLSVLQDLAARPDSTYHPDIRETSSLNKNLETASI